MPRDGFGCLHKEDISGHISSCSRSLFLPARVLSFVLLSRVSSCSRSFFLLAFSFFSCSRSFSSCSHSFFLPARILSFVLLSRVLSSCSRSFSSCSRSFSSFFLLAFFLSSFYLAFFLSSFYLAFFPARIHFSQQIPLQNLHISKICCTFALKFKYISTRLVEY